MFTLIAIGGVWFWLLVLAELAFLYRCMGLEGQKGKAAAGSLLGVLVALICFSDLKMTTAWGWVLSHALDVGLVSASYIVLGVLWSFFWMWPRYGKKRRINYKKVVADWLEQQGLSGDSVPDSLKKGWNLAVFGNQDQKVVEYQLKEVCRAFYADMESDFRRTGLDSAEAEVARLLVQADPATIENPVLRREIVEARRRWLKTQGVRKGEFGDVIPDRLINKWAERVTTPYVERAGNPEWASLAAEPLVKKHVGELVTWASWWPVSVLWFFGHDLFHEIWAEIVRISTGILQAMMHREYRSVRADFEVKEDASA